MYKQSVDEIIENYADMVYRLAMVQMKNKADAEDIFQEVFIRLVKHVHKLESEEHMKAWLLRVTLNCCKKHFATPWRQRVVYMEDQLPTEAWRENTPIPLEGVHPVTEALGCLPEKYRSVLHLFYYEELSVSEISSLLKQKESTVKSIMFRGRKMMRTLLEEVT